MSDDLDLRVIDRPHTPDARLVADLEARLEAILATPARDQRDDGDDLINCELQQTITRGRRPTRHTLLAVAAAAACVALVAVVLTDDRETVVTTSTRPQNGWVAVNTRCRNGWGDVELVRPGRQPHPVGGDDATTRDQQCGAFSPDGQRLVYGQGRGPNDQELIIASVHPDGTTSATARYPLTGRYPVGDGNDLPCGQWSPNGRWVAFADSSVGSNAGVLVRVLDTTSGAIRPIAGNHKDFEWRPGTDDLAVAGDDGIAIYTASTAEQHPIDNTGATHLTWSPDGTTIAFEQPQQGPVARLWLANADGTNQRPITDSYPVMHGIVTIPPLDGHLD
jgi:WD40 repeat protein